MRYCDARQQRRCSTEFAQRPGRADTALRLTKAGAAEAAKVRAKMADLDLPLYGPTTRPTGLTMTELEIDEPITAWRHEAGSRRPAFHPKTRDRCPPPPGSSADTSRMVARDDLVAWLDRAAARKVTIISAPAGSGKTSLLRAWAKRPDRAHRIAFVPVRRDEQDAQLFWLALLNAVRHISGTISEREAPPAMPDFNPRTLADIVISELGGLSGRVIVVIDDLQELNWPDALTHLTHLLTNLPPNGHAILATRHDLRLGLHQLRLADELSEIRAADLRFTEGETRELLEASGVTLSEAGTALLNQLTECGITKAR